MIMPPWRQRVRRAQELARELPFAREILSFYVEIALFQEKFHTELSERGDLGDAMAFSAKSPNPCPKADVERFAEFLDLIERVGPPTVARVAKDLAAQSADHRTDLLSQCWAQAGPTARAQDASLLLARAFLQPLAELVRERSRLPSNGSASPLCPLCQRRPALAVLRPLGDGGHRSLVCSFCVTEWDYRRIVCAGCGAEDHSKLPVYLAEDFPYVRVECCDTCKQYIKAIDLTKNGLAEPVVDEIASAPLDLWAQQHGYSKIELNLVGM